jgi:hypothetical protein
MVFILLRSLTRFLPEAWALRPHPRLLYHHEPRYQPDPHQKMIFSRKKNQPIISVFGPIII